MRKCTTGFVFSCFDPFGRLYIDLLCSFLAASRSNCILSPYLYNLCFYFLLTSSSNLQPLNFFLVQESSAGYYTCSNSNTRHFGYCQPSELGQCSSCCALSYRCYCLHLLLCYGLWPRSQYSLLRDFPNPCPRYVHSDLFPHNVDWRHHHHLHPPGDVELYRPCRCFWDLCSCVHCILGVCFLESSRDKRHAP